MKKYGVEYTLQLDDYKSRLLEKYRSEMYRKYGVWHFSQTPEFHKKAHKRYTNPKYPNMMFDSSWEFKVYDFLIENHIQFEYQPEISIPYEYDDRTWTYHPDFLINGKIYEVKGDNFFRINEKTGKEEMYSPWRDDDTSDEEYEWQCGKAEAKHQCMIANNVVILRKRDIKNISEILSGVVNTPVKPMPVQPSQV